MGNHKVPLRHKEMVIRHKEIVWRHKEVLLRKIIFSGTLPKSTLSSDNVTLRAFDFEDDVITYKVKGEIAETYFTVDETTGVVKLRKPFDYEVTICFIDYAL